MVNFILHISYTEVYLSHGCQLRVVPQQNKTSRLYKSNHNLIFHITTEDFFNYFHKQILKNNKKFHINKSSFIAFIDAFIIHTY